MRAANGQELGRRGARLGRLQSLAQAEIAPGGRVGLPEFGGRAREHHLPALVSGARPNINRLVSARRRDPVMLHEHHRPGQITKGRQQFLHVGGVLADGRLVEHVQHVFQPADEGERQPHPLRLAA